MKISRKQFMTSALTFFTAIITKIKPAKTKGVHDLKPNKAQEGTGFLIEKPAPCGVVQSFTSYSTGKKVWWWPEKGDDNNSGMSKESPVRTLEKAESLLS